ncbi:MAG: hypothetical protein K5622_05230, partial [Endomicrobiaceae bacterium]|nr:hypothetical protein [Endomicrobiaceae bacterium]
KKYSINLELSVPNIEQNVCNVENIDKNDKNLKHLTDKENFNEKFCVVPWKKLYINFDGNIRINCDCPNVGRFSETELTKEFLFNKIWNGKEMVKYREKIINNDLNYISKVCSHMSKEEKFLRQ